MASERSGGTRGRGDPKKSILRRQTPRYRRPATKGGHGDPGLLVAVQGRAQAAHVATRRRGNQSLDTLVDRGNNAPPVANVAAEGGPPKVHAGGALAGNFGTSTILGLLHHT